MRRCGNFERGAKQRGQPGGKHGRGRQDTGTKRFTKYCPGCGKGTDCVEKGQEVACWNCKTKFREAKAYGKQSHSQASNSDVKHMASRTEQSVLTAAVAANQLHDLFENVDHWSGKCEGESVGRELDVVCQCARRDHTLYDILSAMGFKRMKVVGTGAIHTEFIRIQQGSHLVLEVTNTLKSNSQLMREGSSKPHSVQAWAKESGQSSELTLVFLFNGKDPQTAMHDLRLDTTVSDVLIHLVWVSNLQDVNGEARLQLVEEIRQKDEEIEQLKAQLAGGSGAGGEAVLQRRRAKLQPAGAASTKRPTSPGPHMAPPHRRASPTRSDREDRIRARGRDAYSARPTRSPSRHQQHRTQSPPTPTRHKQYRTQSRESSRRDSRGQPAGIASQDSASGDSRSAHCGRLNRGHQSAGRSSQRRNSRSRSRGRRGQW
mmetsp:Transcript_42557/g.77285  ORF Transcript_42557/g.77285 Transcript_42557/m.77285 type:complete len:431 (-) Transcript_42557:45-1337(-)